MQVKYVNLSFFSPAQMVEIIDEEHVSKKTDKSLGVEWIDRPS